jgi:hypothetical protein
MRILLSILFVSLCIRSQAVVTYILVNNGTVPIYGLGPSGDTTVRSYPGGGSVNPYGAGGWAYAMPLAVGASASYSCPTFALPGSTSFGIVDSSGNPMQEQYWDGTDGATFTFYVAGVETFTNFTFTADNTLSVPATATWTYNGSIVKQETLSSGQSDSWTTPPIEVSPTPQNFTENTSVTPNTININYGSDGNPGFGNGSGGASGGVSGSGGSPSSPSYSGSGGTGGTGGAGGGNTPSGSGTNSGFTLIPGTNADVYIPNTNAILYQSPSGTASESTLEAVGSTLHSDLKDILAGESILNNTLNQGFFTITNELGQLVTYAYTNGNNDSLHIIGTNLSNIASLLSSNQSPVTVNLTNSNPPLTNYATETTQQGISNLLSLVMSNEFASSQTNLPTWTNFGIAYLGETNYAQAVSDSLTIGDTLEADIASFASDMVGPTISSGSIDDGDWTIHLNLGVVNYTANLSPTQFPNVMSCFAWCRQFEEFLFAFWFMLMVCADLWKAIEIINQTHGVTPTVNPVSGQRQRLT